MSATHGRSFSSVWKKIPTPANGFPAWLPRKLPKSDAWAFSWRRTGICGGWDLFFVESLHACMKGQSGHEPLHIRFSEHSFHPFAHLFFSLTLITATKKLSYLSDARGKCLLVRSRTIVGPWLHHRHPLHPCTCSLHTVTRDRGATICAVRWRSKEASLQSRACVYVQGWEVMCIYVLKFQ